MDNVTLHPGGESVARRFCGGFIAEKTEALQE